MAASGDGMGAASAGLAVCDGRCPLRSSHHCPVRLVCPLRQLRRYWRSGRGSAPTCLTKTPQSFVSPGSARADVEGGRDCSELLQPPKPGTEVEAGAEWSGTETDVYLFQVLHQCFP